MKKHNKLFAYKTRGLPNEDSVTTAQLKGMPTIINKTTVGGDITSGEWLTTVIFYDKRLNPIQTQSNNHVYYTSPNTITDVKTVVVVYQSSCYYIKHW